MCSLWGLMIVSNWDHPSGILGSRKILFCTKSGIERTWSSQKSLKHSFFKKSSYPYDVSWSYNKKKTHTTLKVKTKDTVREKFV